VLAYSTLAAFPQARFHRPVRSAQRVRPSQPVRSTLPDRSVPDHSARRPAPAERSFRSRQIPYCRAVR